MLWQVTWSASDPQSKCFYRCTGGCDWRVRSNSSVRERDTSSASQSHATGQIPRCFAMNVNFMSRPSRSRLRPLWNGPPLPLAPCWHRNLEERTMTKTPIAVLGIDLGKNSCSLAGLDATGAVILRRKMTRERLVAFAAELPSCIVAMEACCGAHFLGRAFADQGHQVRLMSPDYVQPYVKAQKTDDRDAEAIAEAATRPTMRFVSLKTEAQLDLQALHRARERLVFARTALINQLRAVLLERGIILPKGRSVLMRRLDEVGADGLASNPRTRDLVKDLRDECAVLVQRIMAYDAEFAALNVTMFKRVD